VLDWELSTLGHPLADLAYHLLAWRLGPSAFRGMAGFDLAALGIPDEAQYIDAYCRRRARGAVDPQTWNFALAYNMFRLAAIRQGIMRRVLDGNAAGPDAAEVGSRAGDMADAGWSLAQNFRTE
jgi:aminoglycoside phosphotransferase (APT) family kinase protein